MVSVLLLLLFKILFFVSTFDETQTLLTHTQTHTFLVFPDVIISAAGVDVVKVVTG